MVESGKVAPCARVITGLPCSVPAQAETQCKCKLSAAGVYQGVVLQHHKHVLHAFCVDSKASIACKSNSCLSQNDCHFK
jgi:hypothetical protein